MNFLTASLVGFAFTIAGCTSMSTSAPAKNLDLTEAAYRYLFDHNSSAFKRKVNAFCVGNDNNAEPRLLAALSDVEPNVLPVTSCERGNWTVVKNTGQKALIFKVDNIICESVDSCSFRGGYYEGNLSSSSNRYIAKRIEGRWKISLDSSAPQSIS